MDIWSWISEECGRLRDQDRAHLAELLESIPTAVCNGRHQHAEALIDEAIAAVGTQDNDWFELYLRHWRMQSRVLRRNLVDENLGECVRLVDLASQSHLRDCPQSVCASQDLVNCYGLADGPGYVEERIAVARETLERIDPGWGCFVCISEELACAHIDAGQPEVALELVANQRRALLEVGRGHATSELNRCCADAHYELGAHDAALEEINEWDHQSRGEVALREFRTRRALYLAAQGRVAEAQEELPDYEEIADQPPLWWHWARAQEHLCARLGELNEAELSRQILALGEQNIQRGALWPGARIHAIGLRLAHARGHLELARQIAASLQQTIARLRAPATLLAEIEYCRVQLQSDTPVEFAAPDLESFFSTLPKHADKALDQVAWARRRWPENPRVADYWCQCLSLCGLEDWARQATWNALKDHPDHGALAYRLGQQLLDQRDADGLRRMMAIIEHHNPRVHTWFEALSAREHRNFDRARALLEQLAISTPEDTDVHRQLAELAHQRGDQHQRLQHLDAIVARSEPGNADWDRLVAATLVGDWPRLRASSERLGIELGPGEGEPEARSWGICKIRMAGRREDRDYHALRTGPVTARIVELAGPGHTQHYGDELVFDPELLNPSADDDERDASCYPLIAVRNPGGFGPSYAIEGVHPGDDALVAIEVELGDDIAFEQRSGENYMVCPRDGESRRGLYAFIAAKAGHSPADLHGQLEQITERYQLSWAWPSLAMAMEQPELATRMRDDLERMGIMPD